MQIAIDIPEEKYELIMRCGKDETNYPTTLTLYDAVKSGTVLDSDAVSRDFQIGDEVRIIGSDTIYDDCDVGWVIRNASEKVKTMYVMRNDGSADEEAKAEWYKTGRHNAMLAEVIKALPSVTQKQTSYCGAEMVEK